MLVRKFMLAEFVGGCRGRLMIDISDLAHCTHLLQCPCLVLHSFAILSFTWIHKDTWVGNLTWIHKDSWVGIFTSIHKDTWTEGARLPPVVDDLLAYGSRLPPVKLVIQGYHQSRSISEGFHQMGQDSLTQP